jgi:phosphohistidine phosphatase
MELQLLRHGKAEDYHDEGDSARALVAKGHHQARRAGLLLAAARRLPEIVLTSPMVRARQTAEGFCAAACLPGPVVQGWLACGCTPQTALEELAAFHDFKRVMIVGHEPDFSEFIQWTLGTVGSSVEMKKGGLAGLLISPPARQATLLYLLPPKLIRDPEQAE